MTAGHLLNGRYRLLDEIAQGAHEAEDELLGGRRLVRLLEPGVSPSVEQARLRHPNLEEVYECGPVEAGPPGWSERVALVSEPLTEGQTLREELQAHALEPERLADIALGALTALEGLQRLGLCHGGLCPERILLLPSQGIKLRDVGLPAASDSPYLAPEVASGGAPDARSDLYGLGASLYEAAAGRLPDRNTPIPLRELRPEIPASLAKAIATLLEEDPRARAALTPVRELLAELAGPTPESALPPTIEPRFVGRAELLDRIERTLDDAQVQAAAQRSAREAAGSGLPPLLLVEGAEGLGKTRLLAEAAARLARRGARVLLGHGFVARDSYAVWEPLIERAARDAPPELVAAARQASPDSQARHEHITRLLLSLAARQPVALIVDDAHLFDAAAASLLLHLARAAASPDAPGPFAIVLGVRAGDRTPLEAELTAPLAPIHGRAVLNELSPTDARALVASMVPGADDGEDIDRLTQLGGGNPFLLVELTHEWRLGGGTPASVVELVTARLERASGPARELLEGLAVVGRPLAPAGLTRLGRDRPTVDRAVSELIGLGILRSDGEGALRFRYGVARRILLDGLSEDRLEEQCARALAALEQDPRTTPGERARLALQARAPDAAALALAAAAGDAAPEELYQGAIDLMEPSRERARAQQDLAQVYLARGDYAEARRALELARDDLVPRDPPEEARVLLGLSRVASAEGDTNEALRWAALGRSLLEGDEAGGGPVLAELFAVEAQVATVRGDHAGSARLYAKAKQRAEGDRRLLGRLQLKQAAALVLSLDRTRYADAQTLIEEARSLLAELGDGEGELEATKALGNLAWYSGDPAEAEVQFREALALSERCANMNLAAGLLNNLGLVAQAQGKLSQAEAFLERSLDIAERIGQPAVLCRAYTNVGRVRRSLGDARSAERSFRQAARVAHDSGDPMIESAALSELGYTRLAGRRVKAALRAFRRSMKLRMTLGDVGRVAESELELAELWRTSGDVRAALGCTVRATGLLASLGDLDGLGAAVEAMEFAVGRPGGPAALLAAARRRLDRMKAPAPVLASLRRGIQVGELALRTLAAAIAGRAGDVQQAQTHADYAATSWKAIKDSDLSDQVIGLASALELEAQAVVLAARGEQRAALERIDHALGVAKGVRRGALLLKRAFLCLALRKPKAARASLDESRQESAPLAPVLLERRRVGEALIAAGLRQAGMRTEDELGVLSLAEAQEVAKRLGDVSLLAMVATARAEEAAVSGSPQEAALERAAARIAAGRLASDLPASLQQGLQRQGAPVLDEETAPLALAPDQNLLLSMVSRVLNTGLELDPLLEAAMDALLDGTGAERGLLVLQDPRGALEYRVARNLEQGSVKGHASFAATRAVVEHVARETISVLLGNAGSKGGRFARGRGTPKSVLAVPIRSGRTLGVVYLDHTAERDLFGAGERALVGAFASKIAGPIEASLEREAKMGELSRLAEAYRETARELGGTASQELVGQSPVMRTIHRLVERYGRTTAPVTIYGESGTGKELVARALHQASDRRDGPFIVLNCTAVPATLLESELFGVEKGAFTGADKSRQGLFELAHGGTLFLDEVGDMSLDMQAKLLRVLETGELRPVGGRAIVKVDVRIVSATHHDLHARVAERAFREDLVYRLNVLRVELPPLRDRREDIILLCSHFLEQQARKGEGPPKQLTPEAVEQLMRHPFPGNVRELRNVIERACVLESGRRIGHDKLLLEAPVPGTTTSKATPDYHKTFEFQGVALNRRQRRLLDHLLSGVAAITNREYCALVEVSERTGLRDLTHLVEQGVLVRMGRRKGARYQLAQA